MDAANVFTTDPQLESGDYAVLEDPEKLFGSQNAVMVVDADKLETVGQEQFLRVVDAVNRRLTTDVIVGLNKAVTDGEDDGEVARPSCARRAARAAGIGQQVARRRDATPTGTHSRESPSSSPSSAGSARSACTARGGAEDSRAHRGHGVGAGGGHLRPRAATW